MSEMPGAKFVDTNIWIYAHLRKPNEPRNRIALDWVSELDNSSSWPLTYPVSPPYSHQEPLHDSSALVVKKSWSSRPTILILMQSW
jgi:hypothetical protein